MGSHQARERMALFQKAQGMNQFKAHHLPQWQNNRQEGGMSLELPFFTLDFPLHMRMQLHFLERLHTETPRQVQPNVIRFWAGFALPPHGYGASFFEGRYNTISEALEDFEIQVIPYIQDYAKVLMEQVAGF